MAEYIICDTNQLILIKVRGKSSEIMVLSSGTVNYF